MSDLRRDVIATLGYDPVVEMQKAYSEHYPEVPLEADIRMEIGAPTLADYAVEIADGQRI